MTDQVAVSGAGGRTDDVTLLSKVAKVAGVIASEHYPSGDRAALKRYTPGQEPPLAFYRLWLRHLGTEVPSEAQTAAWALVAWGLAVSGKAAHVPGKTLGEAAADSGYSEARLERLLAASDTVSREKLLASLVRFLAAKAVGFNWVAIAAFLLLEEGSKRESLNRRIATDYYRALHAIDHSKAA